MKIRYPLIRKILSRWEQRRIEKLIQQRDRIMHKTFGDSIMSSSPEANLRLQIGSPQGRVTDLATQILVGFSTPELWVVSLGEDGTCYAFDGNLGRVRYSGTTTQVLTALYAAVQSAAMVVFRSNNAGFATYGLAGDAYTITAPNLSLIGNSGTGGVTLNGTYLFNNTVGRYYLRGFRFNNTVDFESVTSLFEGVDFFNTTACIDLTADINSIFTVSFIKCAFRSGFNIGPNGGNRFVNDLTFDHCNFSATQQITTVSTAPTTGNDTRRFISCYFTNGTVSPINFDSSRNDKLIGNHFDCAGVACFTISAGCSKFRAYGNSTTGLRPIITAGATDIVIRDNPSINPVGNIASPFDNTNFLISSGLAGAAALPTSLANDYTVLGYDVLITDTAANGGTVTVKDPAGNVISAGFNLATAFLHVPSGFKVRFVTALPTTFVVSGN